MKLAEALRAIRKPVEDAQSSFDVFLACGINPLHLETFLHAHLLEVLGGRGVSIRQGMFGDLPGNLVLAKKARPSVVVAVVELCDLDPRLGIRQAGNWRRDAVEEIVGGLARRVTLIAGRLEQLAGIVPVALSLPTLPLPPVGHAPSWSESPLELAVESAYRDLRARAASIAGCRTLSVQALDLVSPPGNRFDPASELATGFPYVLQHADALAALLARLVTSPAPKKGIITDLDDTLWRGSVGEVGPEHLRWDLDGGARIHGLYQVVLSALADAGTLLAVASRNDPAAVDAALGRRDLLVEREKLFPVEVHWGAKSASVRAILETWNIAAQDVVFVDDSPSELAEVQAAHPGLECLQFPVGDVTAAYKLLKGLRDRCGKTVLFEEDMLRQVSIRARHTRREEHMEVATPEEFLRESRGVVHMRRLQSPDEQRPLELVNKTNQFNLNGRRLSEADWHRQLAMPDGLVLVAAYEDRFGPLGQIAVLAGSLEDDVLRIGTWVMSCRAFARRIEHHMVREAFRRYRVEALRLDYRETPRNGPFRDFLGGLGVMPEPDAVIARKAFEDACPPLYHAIEFRE